MLLGFESVVPSSTDVEIPAEASEVFQGNSVSPSLFHIFVPLNLALLNRISVFLHEWYFCTKPNNQTIDRRIRVGRIRTYGVPVTTRTYGIYRSSFCPRYGYSRSCPCQVYVNRRTLRGTTRPISQVECLKQKLNIHFEASKVCAAAWMHEKG